MTGRQGDATAHRQTPTGEKACGAFAAAYMLLHVWIIASNREHVWQGYHIQNVNAYTSGLKTWIGTLKGVATEYLHSYLGRRRMIDGEME